MLSATCAWITAGLSFQCLPECILMLLPFAPLFYLLQFKKTPDQPQTTTKARKQNNTPTAKEQLRALLVLKKEEAAQNVKSVEKYRSCPTAD